MSDRTFNRQQSLWEKFANKEYRDGFVASHLTNNIASQIYSTRELRGWTQEELADKAGMAQERISVMENSSYEKFSLRTLKRLASALDVALVVRFVPFGELVEYATSMGPDKLAIRDFKNDSISYNLEPLATQDLPPEINLADLPVGQVIDLPLSGRARSPMAHAKAQDTWHRYIGNFNVNAAGSYCDFLNFNSMNAANVGSTLINWTVQNIAATSMPENVP